MSNEKLPSTEQLRKALEISEKIKVLETELKEILTGTVAKSVVSATTVAVTLKAKGNRGMSAAGKARVAEAQKKRWTKIHSAKGKGAEKAETTGKIKVQTEAKPAKKRGMSAAVKAKMSEAKKAYWAKRKATGANQLA